MIDASMLLHMILALDTLEKLIPVEESGEYAIKKREGEALKKACWAEYRARERTLDSGIEGKFVLGGLPGFSKLRGRRNQATEARTICDSIWSNGTQTPFS